MCHLLKHHLLAKYRIKYFTTFINITLRPFEAVQTSYTSVIIQRYTETDKSIVKGKGYFHIVRRIMTSV